MVRLSMIASAKAVMALGSLSVAAQVAPTLTGLPIVGGAATQWTLDGALVIAVGCLVKAVVALFRINAAKDTQIMAMATKVTEALTLNNQALQTANSSIVTNSLAIQELKSQQQQLLREDHIGGGRRRPA